MLFSQGFQQIIIFLGEGLDKVEGLKSKIVLADVTTRTFKNDKSLNMINIRGSMRCLHINFIDFSLCLAVVVRELLVPC